jgi:hypothetical protein
MKLFECSICAYKTSHGSAYKRHIAKIHNRKGFRISLTFFLSPQCSRHQIRQIRIRIWIGIKMEKSDLDPDRHQNDADPQHRYNTLKMFFWQ